MVPAKQPPYIKQLRSLITARTIYTFENIKQTDGSRIIKISSNSSFTTVIVTSQATIYTIKVSRDGFADNDGTTRGRSLDKDLLLHWNDKQPWMPWALCGMPMKHFGWNAFTSWSNTSRSMAIRMFQVRTRIMSSWQHGWNVNVVSTRCTREEGTRIWRKAE